MKTRLFYTLLLLIFCNPAAYSQMSEAKKKQIESMYDFVYWRTLYEDQYIKVEKDDKVGALDDKGNVIIPCKYEKIYKDKDYYEVTLNGKVGALDDKGNTIIPCKYDDIQHYYDTDYYEVTLNGKVGIFDLKGKILLDFKYSEVRWSDIKEESACEAKLDGKKGLIDKKGKVLIPFKYDGVIYSEEDHSAIITLGQNSGVYDVKKGKEVIPCKYSFVHRTINESVWYVCYGGIFDGDKWEFSENGKWGAIDVSNGSVIIPCEYDDLHYINENLWKFNVGGKVVKPFSPVGGLWGVVDSNGKVVFKPEYTNIETFIDGVAQVVKDGVASFIVNPYLGTMLKLANGVSTCKVDNNIPTIERVNDETFAFVFANENYKSCSGADFAINDGKVFVKYCRQTLGIPESNIKYYEDATFGNVQSALKRIQDVADVYDGDAKIIFYFSGLGLTENNQRYILPSDASLSSVSSTGVSVDKILSVLNNLNTKYTFALFDAPFNGTDKSGKMLEVARGVKVRSKTPNSFGKTIAVFGSSDDKNNYCDEKNVHGLLTYNILQQLQQSKGQCGVKTLVENAVKEVEKSSLKDFKEVQTPQIVISETMKENWQTIKF